MEIVVRTMGGIGNQLFQYAAGRYLAKRHGASLRVTPESLRVNPFASSSSAPRRLLLPKFGVKAPIKRLSFMDRLMTSRRPTLALPARLLQARRGIQVIRQAPETSLFHQELDIKPDIQTAYVVGYWQDYSIVSQVESELRREFVMIEPLRGKNLEVATQIRQAEAPVSIHLRRGDYAFFFGPNMQLSMDYYENAIARMLCFDRRSTFFVFSDDPEFARAWAWSNPRLTVVAHNDAACAHEDLRLVSLCRNHIIANSTFSWWGAWLNPRRDKRIIAPANWLGFETTKTAIAQPGWTLLAA
jgi:glycosyl transferase family 11